MADDNLLSIYAMNLAYGLGLVKDVRDEQMCMQPVMRMNHPAWVLGHLAITSCTMEKVLGRDDRTPPGWEKLFGRDSRPHTNRQQYPTKIELVEAYRAGHERLVQAYADTDADALAAPNKLGFLEKELPTIGAVAGFVVSAHEATHLGQLSAWRRALGLPPVRLG